MTVKSKVLAAMFGAAGCATLIFAHKAGPDPWHTGAPGDDPLACSTAKCHVGTPLNGGGGSVDVSFPGGLTYVPGVQQTLTVVITDSAAKAWGLQMTARLASNLTNGQAGDFTATAGQIVICSDQLGGSALFKGTKGCPASSPVQFIEHYLNPFDTNTINLLWTPPATDVGDVHIYIAANAANFNTLETGDHIYTNNYVLTAGKPKPAISTISPSSVVIGSAAVQLAITGSTFDSGSVVSLDGTALKTVFTSSTALTATVPANLLTTARTASITVQNPDGGVSGGADFVILSHPVVSSVAPKVIVAGAGDAQITVSGSGFLSGAVVNFDSTALQTGFTSATTLTATVPAGLITAAGTASITVLNPDSATSNGTAFTIVSNPVISSLSPSAIAVKSPATQLTVFGAGFVSGAVVNLNGLPLHTVFTSATALNATVPATSIASVGAVSITVQNPDGGVTKGVSWTISANPVISNISPASVVVGAAGAQITITGSGFITGSTVHFNSTVVPTVVTNAGALTASVPASLIAKTGTASITVQTPDARVSNSVSFSVLNGPAITGVVNGASFQPGIQSGSWSTIFGSNLSATTRVWGDADFVDGKLPTSLDGVSVMVDNKPAAVYFISPGQINFQAPDDPNTGSVNVTVTNSNGTSNTQVAQLLKRAPGFFMFDQQARKYVAALVANSDGTATFLGPAGLFGASGAATRPAKPGDILELYATGFGPTNPVAPAGQILNGAFPITDSLTVTIGGVAAKVEFAGITGAGLYQINVIAPLTLSPGDQKIVAIVGGVTTPDGAFVTISK